MNRNATPHLIWAVTILIIFGVLAFLANGVIANSSAQSEKVIDAVVKAMEEGKIKISVDLGMERNAETEAN